MSKQTSFKKYQILGVDVDGLTTSQAITYITDRAGDQTSPAIYVTKPYVEFLDRASDPEIRKLLNNSELCLSDGVALNWAAHYLYSGQHTVTRLLHSLAQIIFNPKAIFNLVPERIAGINFTWPLLEHCQKSGLKVFLVGTPKRQTIDYTVDVLRHKLPSINIVGTFPGDSSRQDELLAKLSQAKPDIVLVGMGFPKQEEFMAAAITKLPHGVLVGEGGTFDYQQFGGTVKRAPRLIQKINLEWLWRLILEPKRIIRQLAIPRFIYKVYRQSKVM